MLVIVKAQAISEAKRISKAKGYNINNIAGDFVESLDKEVRKLIEAAVERANQNNRRTLMGRDV